MRRSRVVDDVIMPAVGQDATVLRRFRRWELQLDPVDEFERDTSVIQRAQQYEPPPPAADEFPSRDELLAAVNFLA